MRSLGRTVLSVSLFCAAVGVLFLAGCDTWSGLGKDIGKTGDVMAGKGVYAMTVHATPDKATAAARRAVEQMNMTDIESSGDRSEGQVKAKTARHDGVRIEIELAGDRDSKVTIHTHGDDADQVGKQIQDRINSNL